MNADDWKSMFMGNTSENYQKQVEEEKIKKEEEAKAAEEARLKAEQEAKRLADEEAAKKLKDEAAAAKKKKGDKSEVKTEEGKTAVAEKVEAAPKDFDLNNLESFWQDTGKVDKNKVQNIKYAPVSYAPKKINKEATMLKLTDEIRFSMTDFDKTNKGLANSSINCYMNVCLQSMISCPAFFNMLTAISEDGDFYEIISQTKPLLTKFIELSRYFEPRIQTTDMTN